MENIDRYIRHIASAANANNLAIFVGAGISKTSETDTLKIPDWRQLTEVLLKGLGDVRETDCLKIAQLYYLVFKEKCYYETIMGLFQAHLSPSDVHRRILALNPHAIITTNWDDLLEQTVRDEGYLYDVVASDDDLVTSSLQNKIVKMHGDFAHHNIVFKEDDYINYAHYFPLVENYVKSILSTHTILFLGYSYNDLDLKQIMLWIKNSSKVLPSMYMTVFEANDTQSKYLANHGITALHLNDVPAGVRGNSDYSRKMTTFLERIIHPDTLISSVNDCLDVMLGRLKPLSSLDVILQTQIVEALGDCRIVHRDGVTLEYFDSSLIWRWFDKGLKDEQYAEKYDAIIRIFARAQIEVVARFRTSEYYKTGNTDSSAVARALDFDFSASDEKSDDVGACLDKAFYAVVEGNIEAAYDILDVAVKRCCRQNDYTRLLICLFNKNTVLRWLKFNPATSAKYENEDKTDISERFRLLPKSMQATLKPVLNFVDLSVIYRYLYEASEDLSRVGAQVATVRYGGVSFNREIDKYDNVHRNLLSFVLGNKVLMEYSPAFRKLSVLYIEIAVKRQFASPKITLNRQQIYSCIRHLKEAGLKELFGLSIPERHVRPVALAAEDTEWLINVAAENIIEKYISCDNFDSDYYRFARLLPIILGLVETSEEQGRQIVGKMIRILVEGNNDIGLLDNIDLALGLRVNLHGQEISSDDFTAILNAILSRILLRRYSVGEYAGITTYHCLDALFDYASSRKYVYSNSALIRGLVATVSSWDMSEQYDIAKSWLLLVYEVADRGGRQALRGLLKRIDLTAFGIDDESAALFRLKMLYCKLVPASESKAVCRELQAVVEKYDGCSFSSRIYDMRDYVRALVKRKRYANDFGGLSDRMDELIEIHNRQPAVYRM